MDRINRGEADFSILIVLKSSSTRSGLEYSPGYPEYIRDNCKISRARIWVVFVIHANERTTIEKKRVLEFQRARA